MLEPEETTIDEHEFRYHPLTLKPARKLFDELSQRFGPAIASAIEGLGKANSDQDMEFSEMLGGVTDSAGGLIRGVVAGLDPTFHAKLADTLANTTLYKGPDMDDFAKLTGDRREFFVATSMLTETELIGWCVSVQYADLLAPLRDLSLQAVSLRSVTASALHSRKEQTGLHTASPQAINTATA